MTKTWNDPPLLRDGKPILIYCHKHLHRQGVVIGSDGRYRCRGCRRVVRVVL